MSLFHHLQEYFQKFQNSAMDRMIPFDGAEKDPLLYWRARILLAILFTALALSLFILIPTIPLLLKEELWGLAITDTTALVVGFGLAFGPLSYKIRASITLLLAYATGLAIIVSVGPLSGGPIWLFTFAVLAGILLGARAAVFAIFLNTVTLAVVLWLLNTGQFGRTFPFFKTWEAMLAGGINFILLNVITSVSISVLLKGLVATHEKDKILFKTLEQEKAWEALEKRVEERTNELRLERDRSQQYLDVAGVMILALDDAGTITLVNRKGCEILESPEKNIVGKNWFQNFLRENEAGKVRKVFHQLMNNETAGAEYFEQKIITATGKEKMMAWHNAILRNKQGKIIGTLSSGRDITEWILSQREIKRLQNQIVQSQKMEAIGLMAGGVAHDLNNILSGIVSYPELLLMDLPENSPLQKPIRTIQEAGKRAADVVADLLTMARGVATEKQVLNLNTIVTEYLNSPEFRKLEKTHAFVHFTAKLGPDLLNMSGSTIHMNKVLMNLVINAAEAITGSGAVGISTLNRYMDEPLKGYEDVRRGEYVMLTVSDDGSGISPEDLGRVFEPFYTKKVMGRSGTGLGLAVVWNTVQDHNGYINVDSSEKGTVFELYFPVDRNGITDKKETAGLEDCYGHGETILVVDDEERQREIACDMLKRLGYSAQSVPSGEAAVEYLKENPVDLVLLDMVMPKGMNGRETYEAILKIHPAQKAIIATGYAKTEDVELSQSMGAGHYIKKPYSLRDIGTAVNNELEEKASEA